MIYKTLKKVSEYCQLLDKSKYPATQTINGITFTNNGDGTITVNGTATSTAFFLLFKYSDSLMPKHKYLLSGSPNDASANAYIQCYDDTNFQWLIDTGGGGIAIFPKQVVNPSGATNIRIRIEGGYTANNLVFKPQLFDLTEMYGAGNEPTTVEEFRTKFPNELYDYKPYCFVKSYKNCLKVSDVCQLMVYPYFETTITRNGITFTDNGDGTITANGTSVGFATFVFSKNFNFIAGNKYYVSTPYSIIAYKENGTMRYAQGNILFTWKSNWEIVQVYMQINKGITVSNLTFKPQLFDLTEMYGAGNEPTTVEQFKADFPNELYDYKPYSIVPSYKKSLICTTKNLFDKSLATIPNDIANGKLIETTKNGWIIQGNIATDRPVGTAYWANGWFSPGSYNRSYATIKKGMYLKGGDVVTVSAYYTLLESNITDNIGIYLYGTKSVTSQLRFSSGVGVKTRVYRTLKIADGQDGLYNPVFTLNSSKILIEDIQIEYGTTTTEYHPYGYL